jgi:hypothetical protein
MAKKNLLLWAYVLKTERDRKEIADAMNTFSPTFRTNPLTAEKSRLLLLSCEEVIDALHKRGTAAARDIAQELEWLLEFGTS